MKRWKVELDNKSYSLIIYRQKFVPVKTISGTRYVDTGIREEFTEWMDCISEDELNRIFKLASGMGFVEITDAGLSNETARGQFTIAQANELPKLSRQYPRFRWLPVKHEGKGRNKKGERVGGIHFI